MVKKTTKQSVPRKYLKINFQNLSIAIILIEKTHVRKLKKI